MEQPGATFGPHDRLPAERARRVNQARDEGVIGRGIRMPFTLLGIPLYLDWSFLIVLPLMAFMIGSNVELYAAQFGIPRADTLSAPATRYLLGLIAALGLFVCVILHELGHAITARLYKVEVRNITLWFLGGMAHISEMPRRRGGEAVVAIVGPIVSFALAAGLWLVFRVLPPQTNPGLLFLTGYLTLINLALGLFNLLPALPLDGGRVLRSLLALALPHSKATRIAGIVSKVVAIGLGILGLMSGNLFMIFIALFIFLGQQSETHHSIASDSLEGLSVGQLMSRDVRAVHPWMTVSDLTSVMLDEHHLGFPVLDEHNHLIGLISIRELTGSPRPQPGALVGDVMRREVPTIAAEAPALEALRRIGQDTTGRLVVTDRLGDVIGIITAADLMRAIQVRTLGSDWRAPRRAA